MQSPSSPVLVDLGCGDTTPEGYLGIDLAPAARPHVRADLRLGIPLVDDAVDTLRANDFFEHLTPLVPVFNECWRVLRTGGRLTLAVPRFPHTDAVKDPTHVSFFVVETFTEYLCAPDWNVRLYGLRTWNLLDLTPAPHRIYAVMEPRK